MKRFLILFCLAFSVSCMYAADRYSVKETPTLTKQPKLVYYIVLGSYSSLQAAQGFNYACADGLESWIYKTTVNRKTVYRVCYSCHSTKAKAMQALKDMKDSPYGDTWFKGAWIWPSRGLAQCVFCPVNMEGKQTKPLTPQ